MVPAAMPLALTIGDEFQGLYTSLGNALDATLLVQLHARDRDIDVRFGVGWGRVLIYDLRRAPFLQDGPAWWAARDAVDRARAIERQKGVPRRWRTVFVASDVSAHVVSSGDTRWAQLTLPGMDDIVLPPPRALQPGMEALVNSFLVCRDEIVAGLDKRDARLTIAHIHGISQADVASAERISQSAVAQRLSRNGAYALAVTRAAILEAFR